MSPRKPATSRAPKLSGRALKLALAAAADAELAAGQARFFKTGKGEYGEGDVFLGLTVPRLRKIAYRFRGLPLAEIAKLLDSRIHDHRLAGLEILVAQYEGADEAGQEEVVRFYLEHTKGINNWDLVDLSAPYILGHYLCTRPLKVLDQLASSPVIWERRIAIVATLGLIKDGQVDDTFRIAEKLLDDKHDLIHKAVGWALREAGKVSRPRLLAFLKSHYARIPRTALRYAIEHLTPEHRKRILSGNFE